MKKLIVILMLLMPLVAFATETDGKPEIYKVLEKTFILDTLGGSANDGDTLNFNGDIFSVDCDTLSFIAEWTGGKYNSTTGAVTAYTAGVRDSLAFWIKLQPTSPTGATNPLIVFADGGGGTAEWDTVLMKTKTAALRNVLIGNPVAKNSHYMTAKAWGQVFNNDPKNKIKFKLTIWAVRKWA